MDPAAALPFVLALGLAPLSLGIVNRVKAVFAGRRGPPLLQAYYDLRKLLAKGAVMSRTTTWVFRAGPAIGLASGVASLALLPAAGIPAPLSFPGDLVLFAYFIGLGRFFTVLAALDTGSSFEGMGASREVHFAVFAELALFLGLAALARRIGTTSLTPLVASVDAARWADAGPELAMVAVALFVVLLAENARIPVDDPNTHLELTMIHEVMVLDHGGPDLAYIQYGAALKLWLLSALLVGIAIPVRSGNAWLDVAAFLGGMVALAALVGVVESTTARLRLLRVPQLLIAANGLAGLALVLALR